MTDDTPKEAVCPREATLRECPFCGGPGVIEPKNWAGRDFVGVFCVECNLFMDCRAPTEAEAIAAWNTRATPSPEVSGGDLCERLRATEFDDNSTRAPYQRLINPDGPEAANTIERLMRERGEARRLIEASLYHLRLDTLAEAYHREAASFLLTKLPIAPVTTSNGKEG